MVDHAHWRDLFDVYELDDVTEIDPNFKNTISLLFTIYIAPG